MDMILDQATADWDALVQREDMPAYQVESDGVLYDDDDADSGTTTGKRKQISCPRVWREKICEWQFQVIDHCDIDRDVVSISISYFDRYMSRHSSIDETLYQLVAMTSLYLAVKIHSTRKISVSSMSALSKGHFREDQITKMEICLIKTLRWRLNPPTPSILLNIANPIIDASVIASHHYNPTQTSYEIAELSRYLLELSVCDSYFSDKKPSSITYASVLVAMDTLVTPMKIRTNFASYGLDKAPDVTDLCVQRLRNIYDCVTDPPRATSSPTSVLES